MNPRPLGYEPYDVRLCRFTLSLVAALTSEDGRRAFMSGRLRLSRLNPSRRVLCTNPCTNLVAEPQVLTVRHERRAPVGGRVPIAYRCTKDL